MNIKDLKQRTKTLVGNPIITTEVFGGQADQYVFSILYHKNRGDNSADVIKLVNSITRIPTEMEDKDRYIKLKDLLMFPDDTEILIEGYSEEPWIIAKDFTINYDDNTLNLCGYNTTSVTLADLVLEAKKHHIPFDRVHIYADPGEVLHIADTALVKGHYNIYLEVHNEDEETPSSGPCSRPPKYKTVTPQFLFEYFQENVPYISITLEIVREFLNSDLKCEKVEPNIEILTDLLRDYILSQNLVSAEDIEE